MKIYVRNRRKRFDPEAWWPYQAVLWFKPGDKETWKIAMEEAFQFFTHLKYRLKWSYGSLGRVQGIVDTRWRGDSTGILFSHRKFAEEAKNLYKEWREGENS